MPPPGICATHPRGKPLAGQDYSFPADREVKPEGSDVPQGHRALFASGAPGNQSRPLAAQQCGAGTDAVKPFLFEAAAGIAGGDERPARAAAFAGGPAMQCAVKPFQLEAVLRTTRNRRMFFEKFYNSFACTGLAPSRASPVWGSAEVAQLEERERVVGPLEVRVRIPLSAPSRKRFRPMHGAARCAPRRECLGNGKVSIV